MTASANKRSMTLEQKRIHKNRERFRKQVLGLAGEADEALRLADLFCDGGYIDFHTAAETIPLTIRKVEYRLRKVKELWKKC